MPMSEGMERPDIYVLVRILERLWREDAPILKTRLQLSSRVNYDTLVRYLDWMKERDLIEILLNEGHELVTLTPKGHKAYSNIVSLINEYLRR
jgi:predicted transcriptional regulator